MLKVDLLYSEKDGSQTVAVTFGWDDKAKKIIVLKTRGDMAENVLNQEYRGKRKWNSRRDGKVFLKELYIGISGSRVRATKAYEAT